MTDERRKTSERALQLEQQIRDIQSDMTSVREDQKTRIDALLTKYLTDVADEDDSRVHNLREIAARTGINIPDVKSMPPPVTRPTRERLAETRHEEVTPVTIPAPPPDMTPPTGVPAVKQGPPVAARVLVVDDDEDVLGTLTEILTDEHYSVWRAHDGFDGLLRLLEMPHCDIILLDWMMPKLSGTEFLELFGKLQMRFPEVFGHIQVVLISSGKPSPELTDHFVFMAKPLDLDILLTTVRGGIEDSRRLSVP